MTCKRGSMVLFVFFYKQNTAYEMRISDWSSDVCSSDLSRNAVENDEGPVSQPSCNDLFARLSPRRDRVRAVVVVEAAVGLFAKPARLDIFHQQRAGAVLAVGEALKKHLHHRKAGVKSDEIGRASV